MDDEDEDEDEDESSESENSAQGTADSAVIEEDDDISDDEELSELSEAVDSEADERDAAAQLFAEAQDYERKEKRKRKQDEFHDLESKYFQKLADEDKPANKKRKSSGDESQEETAASGAPAEAEDSDGDIPMHESLAKDKKSNELDKANRTVFLSNVSIEAVNSKRAKRTLLAHLASALDKDAKPSQSVESLRFRSVPFATSAIPKRAAFITKATMEATTHSANAYAVYSTPAAARTACKKLNSTVVLDRHLRVDSVAHPAEVDHRRCVFVGNLGFVDDETVLNVKLDEDGKEKTEKRKRTRVPMDVEEGLWRTFGQHAGKVESVRVVRDQATRVGKGIAYVQFYVSILSEGARTRAASRRWCANRSISQDGNSVESALLLNGKKFPPMLPRDLRVSRCKAPHKTARAMEKKTAEKIAALKASGKDRKTSHKYVPKLTAEQQTMAGRAGKLMGRSAAAQARIAAKSGGKPGAKRERHDKAKKEGSMDLSTIKAPESFIFEGRRASAKDALPKDLKLKQRGKKKSGSGGKPKKSSK